jgi:hypothetical protein
VKLCVWLQEHLSESDFDLNELTSALDRSERSALPPSAWYPLHIKGGCASTACLDGVTKVEFSCPARNWKLFVQLGHILASLPIGTLSKIRPTFFWVITQRRFIILYRRFGKTDRPHLPIAKTSTFFTSRTSWYLKMGPIRYPETSVEKYHSTNSEGRRYRLHCRRSLKSGTSLDRQSNTAVTRTDIQKQPVTSSDF